MNLRITLLSILILLGGTQSIFSQSAYPYQQEFEAAYSAHPGVPKGLLEAISFCQTRFTDLQHQEPGCVGLPIATGVMGLIEDGQGYFNNSKQTIQNLAPQEALAMGTPQGDIMAFAAAFENALYLSSPDYHIFATYEHILRSLSEIPTDGDPVNEYALSAHTYQILDFLRDEENQAKYSFPAHDIDLKLIYGEQNLKLLSAKKVLISGDKVQNAKGDSYQNDTKSFDYGPALWVATPTCNYSSRSGTPVSAVTIHTIQGSYAGAISWAQNCSANVSYHYVVRSTDGQVTQMVYEADKGWHVGSENPYTIGIEHEGYVDNPAWYTVSLYTASAGIVKDITQSGYGINPLRTFQGPATTGGNVLGGCTKIKGHQHYPNQSHTDPGINWDWEYFYQLINDAPVITSLTTSSGTYYDSGGAGGNYSDDERELTLIQPANVLSVTISFAQFSLEDNWDYMYVYDGSSLQDPLIGVYTGSNIPADITSTGDALLIEFRSDCATQDAGWEINWTSVPGPVPGDVVAPTSSVGVSGNWQTTDFTANFTDVDNVGGSGVHHKFYQVIDFDGTEWRANDANGFFSDNFDVAIHADWTQQVGTWGINSMVLEQTDEGNTNTNIWASLNQDNYDQWLYHFSMNVDGIGGNKRAGFHFMCDDATLPNRGNSYFIWLRSDDDKIQIYKVISDVFQLEADIPYTINDGQWYDIKTVYDKSTGVIQVYVDNVMEASWIDATPYTSGNAISLRSGDAIQQVNNLKVYHNRGASELVTINTGNDAQYQNQDPLTHAAKVKTIAIDSSANISSIDEELVNIDWTNPLTIPSINDGTGADINVTTTNTEISANWAQSSDPNSDIARYWYAIGTSPLATDVVGWTDNWFSDTLTHAGLALVEGTTYYTCVYAENGAGLYSDTICTDGQTVQAPTAVPTADFIVPNSYICAFQTVQVLNSSLDAQTYLWDAPGATPSSSTDANPMFTYTATGSYDITLTATGVGGVDTEIQTIFVNIDTVPVASYVPSDFIVDISNAFVTFNNTSQHANGYLWDFGDGVISTDVNPWHQFTALGVYPVELIAVNGLCPNDTTLMNIQVVDNLGLEDAADNGVSFWPNPAKDLLKISLDDSWGTQINCEMSDARGRLVFSKKVETDGEIEVNLAAFDLEEAIYFITVSDGEKVISRKIIVKPG